MMPHMVPATMQRAARAPRAHRVARAPAEAMAVAVEDQARAKTIIATAIQRYASEFVHERTVAVVALPSDDMKGRLIGREGRNIRALEAARCIVAGTMSGIILSGTPGSSQGDQLAREP